MSGAGDGWRVQRGPSTSGGVRPPRGGPAGREKSSGLSAQEIGQTAAPSSPGAAWAPSERPSRAGSTVGVVEDRHVSVGGFDGQEARQLLRKAYQESTSQEEKPTLYKAASREAMKAKAAGPWGSKPNHMANGQDFFVQLRKGMATLLQSGAASKA